ncbi:EmrB/QacA subfamily drug resistance transporter [Isoptericola halotolerans]|uniref:EmrB/QacA subfamily drug resistance transporter n=2 Tax=Isoptericola halotolerans TaxID=300560 RepID=A0ABX2A9V2_9MICO|nr:EmrB/QacA subfamily drug resistance transporter [Isoptericola halotolerans]
MSGDSGTTGARRRWWCLAVVCLAMFMGVLDSTSVYAALPEIAAELDFAPAEVQWVITAYGMAIGGLLLLGGRLADRLGRRRVFLASVGLFAVASLACGLAASSELLIAARALQGVGAAVMTPAGLSLLMGVFPDGPDRNKALGIWGGLGGTGASVGLLLGGVLTDRAGWEWIFLTNVPVCLLVLAVGPALLPEATAHRQRLDLPGAVTATGGLVLLLLALFRVAEHGVDTLTVLLLAGTVVAAALFVVVEQRSPAPLVPLRIFASRALVGGNVVILTAGIAVDGLLIVMTLYAQQVLGFSALQFGLTMAIMTVTSVLGVLAGQHLVTRSGFRLVAPGGMTVLAGALVLLSRLSSDGTLVRDLLAGLVLFGAGMGAAFVAGQIAALSGVADGDAGLAAGLEETSFAVGTTLGAALASAVVVGYAVRDAEPTTTALTDGFAVALLVLAGVATIGAVLAVTLLGAGRRHEPVPESVATAVGR